ncbi:MAG: alanyl-tRNA editing protein [Acidimicrobiia bacterium]|nr:alanyl-tRNA editing protein [Acidimicrobiia bacterium]
MRLYLVDSYLATCDTSIVDADNGWWLLSDTVFYPGGGGQPADTGTITFNAETHRVDEVRSDHGEIWHRVNLIASLDSEVQCRIDWDRRYALMRHHALLHIVNTIARRAYGGLITGTLIGTGRSRIDFSFEAFDRSMLLELESEVNEVISGDLPISASTITEAEFPARPDLIRTRNVLPPIEEGKVRIVEIGDLDAQACGGTHVHSTGEIRGARIDRFENKGRDNKRLYSVLEE